MFKYNEKDDQQNQHYYPVLEWDGSLPFEFFLVYRILKKY